MENYHYLAFAIPAFFLFLFIEYKVAQHKKMKDVFNYEGSISNISVGIAERLMNLFITGAVYGLFVYIYDNFAIFNIPNQWWVWIVLLLATDFVWYWYHRMGHESNIFWAAHIVHHQSDEFNFTVAARITVFQSIIRTAFWSLLPLMGFHPTMVMTILVVHGVYSFFTHTQIIGKIPWLEHVLITPSLHGVHHASDEKYLDKNYGDIFVFWDKMFGTFQAEEEKPKYGLTHPLKSYSFLWQHFHYYLEIWEGAKMQNTLKGKLKVIFGSPAVMDQNIRPSIEKKYFKDDKDKDYHFKYKAYLNIQIFAAFILMIATTFYFAELTAFEKFLSTSVILITLINCGALMEQRKWIYYLEYIRIILILSYVFYYFGHPEFIFVPIILAIVIEQAFNLSGWYNSYVQKIES